MYTAILLVCFSSTFLFDVKYVRESQEKGKWKKNGRDLKREQKMGKRRMTEKGEGSQRGKGERGRGMRKRRRWESEEKERGSGRKQINGGKGLSLRKI